MRSSFNEEPNLHVTPRGPRLELCMRHCSPSPYSFDIPRQIPGQIYAYTYL